MATYGESTRSNYFGVKDKAAFARFCDRWSLEMIEEDGDCGFLAEDGIPPEITKDCDECDQQGSNSAKCRECAAQDKRDEEADFGAELCEQIVSGAVAVIITVGQEKMRYLSGDAAAYSPDHDDPLTISTYDIYKLVKDKWGVETRPAEY